MDFSAQKVDKDFALITSPVFRRLFFLVRMVGCMLMMANVVTETAYLFKNRFSTVLFFSCYFGVCVLKATLPFVIMAISFVQNVCFKKP